MPMSQVATDNFIRANEAPLSDGGNWSAGYLGGGTGLAVVSDACEQGATTAQNTAIWTGYTWPSDHYSEFSFTNSLATYGADLVVRMQENAGVWSAYTMLIGSTTGTNNLILRYYSNYATNTFTALTTTPSSFAATPLSTDIWRFQASGSTLTVYQNGTLVLTATDTNLTGGTPGILISGAQASNLKITLWNGGAVLPPVAVQSNSKIINSSSSAASSLAFSSNNTAGNSIVVIAMWLGGSGTTMAINDPTNGVNKDSNGNTYTSVHGPDALASTFAAQVWVANNIAAGANTLTLKPGQSQYWEFVILEYAHSFGAADQFADHTASLAAMTTTATGTTTDANELILAYFFNSYGGASFSNGGQGFSFEQQGTGTESDFCVIDQIVASEAAYTGTILSSVAATYGGYILTLPINYSISGSLGALGAGATVSYTGTASGSVTADGSGNYTISGLLPGTYTITPTLAGYTFSPKNQVETITSSNITGVNFTTSKAATGGVITADMSTKYQARIFTSRAARSISGPRKTEVRTKPS